MIFQLKVTLKGFKPPVWRRVEVKDTMTFSELHRVIQIAFDWTDTHLHEFQVKKMNSTPIDEFVVISPADDDEFISSFISEKYDEKILNLKAVFKKEKDRVLYIYDFGDNWEHDIVLEKILPEQEDMFYPCCTKVMREAPNEDSRFEYLESPTTPEIDGEERMNEINYFLHSAFTKQDSHKKFSIVNGKNKADSSESWAHLLDLTDEFKKIQLWNWLDDDQLIAIQNPDTEEWYICSVLGSGGMEFGLAAFRGISSIAFFNRLVSDPTFKQRDYMIQDSLTVNFSNRKDLSNKDYKLLKKFGRSYRGKNQWPVFRSIWPGFYPWYLEEEEVQELTYILKQMVNLSKHIEEIQEFINHYKGDGKVFVWVYDEQTDTWDNGHIIISEEKNTDPVPITIPELVFSKLKRTLKRSNEVVELDCDYVLTPIQNMDDERPYYPMLMLTAEEKFGQIVYYEMFMDDTLEAVQFYFLDFLEQFNCIPKKILVKEMLAFQIEPIAEKFDINLKVVKSLPNVERARDEMEAVMSRY